MFDLILDCIMVACLIGMAILVALNLYRRWLLTPEQREAEYRDIINNIREW